MSGTAFTCPECGASARSAREIAEGALVKCPSCAHVFRFGEPSAPPAPKAEVADEPRPRRRDDEYDDDDRPRRRRYDDEDDRRIRSRRDDDYDDRPRPRRRDDDDYDDRRRRRKKKGVATSMVFVVVFLLMIVGIAGGVLAYAYKTTGTNEVVSKVPPGGGGPPPRLGGGFVGEGGFGGNFETTGLSNPEEPGEDKGKLSDGAASLLTGAALASNQPRTLNGPPSPSAKSTIAGSSPVLEPAVLGRVKLATTMMICKRGSDGQVGSGSGFFVGENLVMTNAHVVGMLGPGTPKPQRLDVILNSGDAEKEAKCSGEVLVVDREHDLALVRCGTPDNKKVKFPPPLTFAATSSLNDTQLVWVFGFPLGESIGKRVTVNQTQISSIRHDKTGTRVQTNRGMDHGNSGGPVVDSAGQVIGVSVAGIKDTNINFAVAGDHGTALLDGHLDTLTASSTARKGSDYAVPITISASDPNKRIKAVTLEWWWGKAAEKNPALRGKPAAANASRQRVTLKRDGDKFTGEVVVGPAIQDDKVLWLQPFHTDGADEVRYEGLGVEVFPSAEAKPITFSFHPRRTEGLLGVRNTGTYRFATKDGGVHVMEMDIAAVLREERLGKGDGAWVFRDHFKEFKGNVLRDGQAANRSMDVLEHDKHIRRSTLELQTDEHGKVTAGRPVVPNDVPDDAKRMVSHFASQLARGIEFASVYLPAGQIEPGHTWKDQRQRELGEPGGDTKVTVNFEYKYVGVRKMDGREVAELTVTGSVADQFNEDDGAIRGKARGTVYVDVRTGIVSRANLGIDVSRKTATFLDSDAEIHSTVEVSLQRE